MALPVLPVVPILHPRAWCHPRWLIAAAAFLLVGGCTANSLVGIPAAPERADRPAAGAGPVPTAAPPRSSSAELVPWDDKWRKIQAKPESVALGDHWRVCEIKFRFRIYRDLFLCLDMVEARSDMSPSQRQYAPVMIGWMRAGAYAELGQTPEALKWAESGWRALPQKYRDASAVSDSRSRDLWSGFGVVGSLVQVVRLLAGDDDFAAVAIEAGGSRWSSDPTGIFSIGLDNPAGLDMRPQAIAMNLAAERAMLHQQLGETEQARAALHDLDKWKGAATIFESNRFEAAASALSLGALFAMGDYAGVVRNYDDVAREFRGLEFGRTVNFVTTAGLGYLAEKLVTSDARAFAVSLENASRALLYAMSLSRLGETDRARKVFDAMLAAPDLRDMGSIYWATLYERSQIALKDGKLQEAIVLLRRATDAIEQVRGSIAFEAGKIGFATNTQAVYGALVRALAESGDWTGAFLATERAKARALVDLLAQVRDLRPPSQSGDHVRALLTSATASERDIGLPANKDGAELRSAVAAARGELATTAPEAASLLSVQTVPLDAIAARLAPNETLLSYFRSGDRLYGFVVSGAAVKGFQLDGKGLNGKVRAFRDAIQDENATAIEIGQALYDVLIRPMGGELKGAALTISPHDVLHYLPFAALYDGQRYLVDRYSLRMMPSASALVYLRPNKPRTEGGVLALGNPDLGDPRFDLPGAQKEAVAIAHMFPASRALVRDEASKSAVIELGDGFSILHIASHGVFEADAPLTSGLLLAKGTETDGRLTVSDLYKMRLDADLVTLSGCETALGRVAGGDDVIGLTRGFFYAGARTIVASLWEVVDTPTERLMLSFYQNLANTDKREALRRAEIETRRAFPAARYWAAFELTGSAN